jgi:ATP-dependent DNA helicase RecG
MLQLRCAVFASTDTATIIDRHGFTGDVLDLIEEAQKYIIKNIHIGMRLDGLYRVDVPEISVAAMREAIINAFCHRDYHDPDYVQVAIFKDRVEIRNPGKLYGGLTIEKIRKGNVSQRRNPLIAEMLRRIQMVETWGRGMRLILAEEPTAQFGELAQLLAAPPSMRVKKMIPVKRISGKVLGKVRGKQKIGLSTCFPRIRGGLFLNWQ